VLCRAVSCCAAAKLASNGKRLEFIWDEGGTIFAGGMPPFTHLPIALVATAEKFYQVGLGTPGPTRLVWGPLGLLLVQSVSRTLCLKSQAAQQQHAQQQHAQQHASASCSIRPGLPLCVPSCPAVQP
jgi:hypothetical protein